MKINPYIVAVAYVAMAAFTYGYAYNEEYKVEAADWPQFKSSNRSQAQTVGLFCATFWPLYWPLHASAKLWAPLT